MRTSQDAYTVHAIQYAQPIIVTDRATHPPHCCQRHTTNCEPRLPNQHASRQERGLTVRYVCPRRLTSCHVATAKPECPPHPYITRPCVAQFCNCTVSNHAQSFSLTLQHTRTNTARTCSALYLENASTDVGHPCSWQAACCAEHLLPSILPLLPPKYRLSTAEQAGCSQHYGTVPKPLASSIKHQAHGGDNAAHAHVPPL